MEIIKDINSDRLEKVLENGLTEVKTFYKNGQLAYHYFKDENGWFQGEWKRYGMNGTLINFYIYIDGYCVGDGGGNN